MNRLECVAEQEKILKGTPIAFRAFLKNVAKDYVQLGWELASETVKNETYIEKLEKLVNNLKPCLEEMQVGN